jgi:hypothetical protein
MTLRTTFAVGFLGGVAAIVAWQVGVFIWRRYGWWSVGIVVAVAVLASVAEVLRYWSAGRRGLGQWPDPHGRYYDEWMSLPENAGDYYEWLAKKMDGREPWASWARAERRL